MYLELITPGLPGKLAMAWRVRLIASISLPADAEVFPDALIFQAAFEGVLVEIWDKDGAEPVSVKRLSGWEAVAVAAGAMAQKCPFYIREYMKS